MILRRTLLAAIACATSFRLAGAATEASAQGFEQAQWMQPQERERAREQGASRVLSVREIADIVRSQRGGQLLDVVVLEDGGDRPFYVLRWRRPDGVVEDIRVDATSGRVMGRVG